MLIAINKEQLVAQLEHQIKMWEESRFRFL